MYEAEDFNFLVDIGLTSKRIIEKLTEINIDPSRIDVIFITHEHTDHIKGLQVFLKKYPCKVVMRAKTYQSLNYQIENIILIEDEYQYGNITFKRIDTSHDAADSMGLIINEHTEKIVHITDSGYLREDVLEAIEDAHTYLIESNYDYDILIESEKYPFMTKKRIMSDHGHLSNIQCNDYLQRIVGPKTKNVLFAHLSPNNNEPEIVATLNENIDTNKLILSQDEIVSCQLGE